MCACFVSRYWLPEILFSVVSALKSVARFEEFLKGASFANLLHNRYFWYKCFVWMLHRKMACVCECTGINAYTGLRVTRDMWRSPANTKKSKSAILTIEKQTNPHTLKFEKSFSMTCFFFFSNIWMECVGKMGYFIGRCIFYNIIHISRLVEIIEYSICTNFKKSIYQMWNSTVLLW